MHSSSTMPGGVISHFSFFILHFAFIFLLAGCSSIPLPSLPSLPWSGPAVQPNPTAEALFKEGMTFLNEKRYLRAIDRFLMVKAEFPFSPQLLEAELKLAEAYYLNKQYPEAITAFREFQAMHPNNEHVPFVVYHLGLAHFDQFTSIDRDQKVTEIAKGYFETVIRNHPNSPYARPAREKLAQCLEHLAEHEFGIASFYLREEKYPAARDRFEGIVRNYRGTQTAVKALYQLGESYRLEKNPVKAALAYKALIQYYPEDPLAKTAQARLSEVGQEKQDPLAMLLMRDGRPTSAPPPEIQNPKSKIQNPQDLNLVEKKGVVDEQPGDERGMVERVVDTLNPFAPSRGNKTDGDIKAAQNAKDGSPGLPVRDTQTGFFGSLWTGLNPFSKTEKPKIQTVQDTQLVGRIDDSLKQRGVATVQNPQGVIQNPQSKIQNLELQPPVSDLPKIEEPAPSPVDTAKLVGEIDARLKKEGKETASLPPIPEIHPVLKSAAAKETPRSSETRGSATPSTAGSLIANIDEGLKRKGIEAPKATPIPPGDRAAEQGAAKPEKRETKSKVELDTKFTVERGPLFLEAGEFQPREKTSEAAEEKAQRSPSQPTEIPQAIIKGPPQPAKEKAPETNLAEKKNPDEEEENQGFKGALDRLKEDVKAIGNLLNPFKW